MDTQEWNKTTVRAGKVSLEAVNGGFLLYGGHYSNDKRFIAFQFRQQLKEWLDWWMGLTHDEIELDKGQHPLEVPLLNAPTDEAPTA